MTDEDWGSITHTQILRVGSPVLSPAGQLRCAVQTKCRAHSPVCCNWLTSVLALIVPMWLVLQCARWAHVFALEAGEDRPILASESPCPVQFTMTLGWDTLPPENEIITVLNHPSP